MILRQILSERKAWSCSLNRIIRCSAIMGSALGFITVESQMVGVFIASIRVLYARFYFR